MTVRLTALFVTTALLGFLIGARAVGVPSPENAAASSEHDPLRGNVREHHPLRGGFWRPAGSDAARPVVRLAPVAWTPAASDARGPRPAPIAAVRAALRLASLE